MYILHSGGAIGSDYHWGVALKSILNNADIQLISIIFRSNSEKREII